MPPRLREIHRTLTKPWDGEDRAFEYGYEYAYDEETHDPSGEDFGASIKMLSLTEARRHRGGSAQVPAGRITRFTSPAWAAVHPRTPLSLTTKPLVLDHRTTTRGSPLQPRIQPRPLRASASP